MYKTVFIFQLNIYHISYHSFQVTGRGLNYAHALAPHSDRRVQDAPVGVAGIRTLPPKFTNNITAYTKKDIMQLIVFYNEDFGITADDDEPEKSVRRDLSHVV